MNHDRRARGFTGFERQAQCRAAVLADRFLVQADLDADADIAVIADRLGGAFRIGEYDIEYLSGRVENAMLDKRDKPKHARSRGLVHQFPESDEINGSGRAG